MFSFGCLVASPAFLAAAPPIGNVPEDAPNDPLLDELRVRATFVDVGDREADGAGTPSAADHHPSATATPIPLPAPLLFGLAGLGVSAAAARRKRRRPPL